MAQRRCHLTSCGYCGWRCQGFWRWFGGDSASVSWASWAFIWWASLDSSAFDVKHQIFLLAGGCVCCRVRRMRCRGLNQAAMTTRYYMVLLGDIMWLWVWLAACGLWLLWGHPCHPHWLHGLGIELQLQHDGWKAGWDDERCWHICHQKGFSKGFAAAWPGVKEQKLKEKRKTRAGHLYLWRLPVLSSLSWPLEDHLNWLWGASLNHLKP